MLRALCVDFLLLEYLYTVIKAPYYWVAPESEMLKFYVAAENVK